MRKNNEVGNGLPVDQVALKYASTASQVIKLAMDKGLMTPVADNELSDEEIVRAHLPAENRRENYGRSIVRDFIVGPERGGDHAGYILDLCGGIGPDEGVMRYQNVPPATGGSGAIKFAYEQGVVTRAEPILDSRF
jgi:hypothetical protein